MKRHVLLTLTALLSGVALGQSQYLAGNISRTYYLGELETCPGKLDLQVGDLWTLTFPQPIADSFVTRDGLVERKVIDNRMIIAVTGSSGSTPAMVLTEDGKAPRFDLTITPGPGNRNKNVVIKPGFPAKPTPCNLNQISVTSPRPAPLKVASTTRIVAVNPNTIKSPPTTVVSAPRVVNVTAARVTASSPVQSLRAAPAAPLPPAVVRTSPTTSIAMSSPVASAWTIRTQTKTPVAQANAPAPVSRAFTPTPATVVAPAHRGVREAIQVEGPDYLKTTLQISENGLLATFISSLDADISFDAGTLQFGNAHAKYPNALLVPAGGKVQVNIPLEGSLPNLLAVFRLDGSIVGSGEAIRLRELIKL